MILLDENKLTFGTIFMILQDYGVKDPFNLTDEEVERELDRFRTFCGQRAKCKMIGDGLSDAFIEFLKENNYFRGGEKV